MRLTRSIVPTGFGQVHARLGGGQDGANAAPLVLLHMSPRSGQMWERLQARLARPTVALDRLGYGFSDPPPRALSMEEYARSTLEALEALGIEPPFDLLGMHTGSLEAIELAHLAPEKVRRVAIVAAPVFDDAEREEGLRTLASARVLPQEDGSHLLAAWKNRFLFRSPPWDLADVQRRLVDYLLAPYPGEAYIAVFKYDAATRLRTLPRPLTVFVPRDDVYEVSRRARALLPAGAEWVDLPHLGIDLFRDAASEMAALVERHLPSRRR